MNKSLLLDRRRFYLFEGLGINSHFQVPQKRRIEEILESGELPLLGG